MSDKTPGQIAYEATPRQGRPFWYSDPHDDWFQLDAETQDYWEVAAHAIQKAFIERALVETERQVQIAIRRTDPYIDPDWGTRGLKCLSYNYVWHILCTAGEDLRKTCSTGKCIQCRNPHYDGLCECIGEEI